MFKLIQAESILLDRSVQAKAMSQYIWLRFPFNNIPVPFTVTLETQQNLQHRGPQRFKLQPHSSFLIDSGAAGKNDKFMKFQGNLLKKCTFRVLGHTCTNVIQGNCCATMGIHESHFEQQWVPTVGPVPLLRET
jgi:hypothetical protein